MMVWAAVWNHLAEFIAVAASSLAVVVCFTTADRLGLGAAACRKGTLKRQLYQTVLGQLVSMCKKKKLIWTSTLYTI